MTAETEQSIETSAEEEATVEGAENATAASASGPDDAPAKPSGPTVMLGEYVEIYTDSELDELSRPGAKAYEAVNRERGDKLFVLLCRPSLLPRITQIDNYKSLRHQALVTLYTSDIITWPKDNKQYLALAFKRPNGPRIVADIDQDELPEMAHDKIVSSVIVPVANLLSEFQSRDMVHGAINLGNMFCGNVAENAEAMLGECLSSPHSYGQSALFEPAHRAMADPIGRGFNQISDDLYAFGVCVAMLANGVNLLAGKTEEEIIQNKMQYGTYTSLVGGERLSAGLTEFLRGVLSDDPKQRWDLEDVNKWLDGRRLSPKQSKAETKAQRPFSFNNEKYYTTSSLAISFARNVEDAVTAVTTSQFSQWLKRSFQSDKVMLRNIDVALSSEMTSGVTPSSRERLISYVCMVLDPKAPLYYKGITVMPLGFGTALANAIATGKATDPYAEMLNQHFFSFWLGTQPDMTADITLASSILDKARNFVKQTKVPGFGIERVAYALSRETPCLSELVKDYFVTTAPELLQAIEQIAMQGRLPARILDTHMIAFLSEREPKAIDSHLTKVVSDQDSERIIGTLRTFALIQKRNKMGPVPAMGNWFIANMAPVLDRIYNRDLRKTLTSDVQKFVDQGNLQSILHVVDNADLMRDDEQRFAMAQQHYRLLTNEGVQIYQKLRIKNQVGARTGRQVAMLLSSILSTIVILGLVIMHFTGMG